MPEYSLFQAFALPTLLSASVLTLSIPSSPANGLDTPSYDIFPQAAGFFLNRTAPSVADPEEAGADRKHCLLMSVKKIASSFARHGRRC
jgi:hypothetical protein